ncbi:MAG: hypothetical protein D6689_01430 [Deltaproteobacteria bacterium]|nr:MAG: hypothetical protein D6689_01430 [Deltaproteobacteria bacterium]
MTGLQATVSVAKLALARARRGRLAWITAAVLLAPAGLAAAIGSRDRAWDATLEALTLLVAVVPALWLAPALAEEIEDDMVSYLWSRPIPRWSVVAGKWLAFAPSVAAGLAIATVAAHWAALGAIASAQLPAAVAAVAVGAVAAAGAAAGVGSIAPRHPTTVAIAYLALVDLIIGQIPFAIQQLSVTHHVRTIAHATTAATAGASAVRAVAIAAAWLAIAAFRAARAEPGDRR